MKILHITFESVFHPQGGMGVFVREVAKEQAKKHKVSVIGFDPINLEYTDTIFQEYRVVNCKSTSIFSDPTGFNYLIVLYDMLIENLLYHFKKDSFDIIHLHDTLLWQVAKYASILFDAPIVTHCHLSHALVHSGATFSSQRKYEVTQEYHAYLKSHKILTCSEAYKKEVQEYFSLDRSFEVITNGVDSTLLRQYSYDKSLNYKIGKGKQVIGFVGRLVPSKGISLILDAIQEFPNKMFVLIANVSPTVEDFTPYTKKLQSLQERVDNFLWVRDLQSDDPKKWEIMASCDLAIVPSLHEPWGIVTDEWGALRVPKIVSSIGGLLEHNTNEDSILIRPNTKDLFYALKHYKPDLRKVSNAFKNACASSWSAVVEKIEKCYREVL